MKSLSFILIFGQLLAPLQLALAAPDDRPVGSPSPSIAYCSALLSEPEAVVAIEAELDSLLGEQGPIGRLVLAIRRGAIERRILAECALSEGCSREALAVATKTQVKQLSDRGRNWVGQARGYAILLTTMIGTSALTSAITQNLPKSPAFLAQFVSQVSTIGMYVFGAPIWERVNSRFRALAFGASKMAEKSDPGQKARLKKTAALERQWGRTQEGLSLNAQVSRGVLSQYLLAARDNFRTAFFALQSRDLNDARQTGRRYAVDQLAEAAVNLKTMYFEIAPTDETLARAVRASFTHHVASPESYVEDVLKAIQKLDAEYDASEEIRRDYRSLVEAWLN